MESVRWIFSLRLRIIARGLPSQNVFENVWISVCDEYVGKWLSCSVCWCDSRRKCFRVWGSVEMPVTSADFGAYWIHKHLGKHVGFFWWHAGRVSRADWSNCTKLGCWVDAKDRSTHIQTRGAHRCVARMLTSRRMEVGLRTFRIGKDAFMQELENQLLHKLL